MLRSQVVSCHHRTRELPLLQIPKSKAAPVIAFFFERFQRCGLPNREYINAEMCSLWSNCSGWPQLIRGDKPVYLYSRL